jgi:hypothetical protein
VPRVRTAKKQNGKSKADNAKYTPNADHPYSRDSFFSRCERVRAGSGLPRFGVGFGVFECGVLLLLNRRERKRRESRARSVLKKNRALCWRELEGSCFTAEG